MLKFRSFLTEAKRMEAETFYNKAKEIFPNHDEDQFDDIMLRTVAKHNDGMVPGYVRGQKTGKGTFSIKIPT